MEAARESEDASCGGLGRRKGGVAIAGDVGFVAQRRREGLAQHDAYVFHGVVVIYV